MGQIHVDDMTLDILCTNVQDFMAEAVGTVCKNVFRKNRPDSGARQWWVVTK